MMRAGRLTDRFEPSTVITILLRHFRFPGLRQVFACSGCWSVALTIVALLARPDFFLELPWNHVCTILCVDAFSTLDDRHMHSLPITIGRGEDADICINDHWASRHNCRLSERDGQLWVCDLKSSNGTRVNGQLVQEQRVASGDVLTVGITSFRVTFSRLPKLGKRDSQPQTSQLVGSA